MSLPPEWHVSLTLLGWQRDSDGDYVTMVEGLTWALLRPLDEGTQPLAYRRREGLWTLGRVGSWSGSMTRGNNPVELAMTIQRNSKETT